MCNSHYLQKLFQTLSQVRILSKCVDLYNMKNQKLQYIVVPFFGQVGFLKNTGSYIILKFIFYPLTVISYHLLIFFCIPIDSHCAWLINTNTSRGVINQMCRSTSIERFYCGSQFEKLLITSISIYPYHGQNKFDSGHDTKLIISKIKIYYNLHLLFINTNICYYSL